MGETWKERERQRGGETWRERERARVQFGETLRETETEIWGRHGERERDRHVGRYAESERERARWGRHVEKKRQRGGMETWRERERDRKVEET